ADYALKSKLSIPQTAIQNSRGGEQSRLNLASLLSNYDERLLIDEPTPHLGEQGRQFLQEELEYYYGALVLVSHDRYVLDQLVTKIWEIEDGQITEYTGNYTDDVEQKELAKRQQQEQYEKYLKEKSRLKLAAEEKMKKADNIINSSAKSKKKTKEKT